MGIFRDVLFPGFWCKRKKNPFYLSFPFSRHISCSSPLRLSSFAKQRSPLFYNFWRKKLFLGDENKVIGLADNYKCNKTDGWTGPLACLALFSVKLWIRVSALVWNPIFTQSCTQIKRLRDERELNSLFLRC